MPFAATCDHHTKVKLVRERQIRDITYMWNLTNDTNELTYKKKQTHVHRKQNLGLPNGKGCGEG